MKLQTWVTSFESEYGIDIFAEVSIPAQSGPFYKVYCCDHTGKSVRLHMYQCDYDGTRILLH